MLEDRKILVTGATGQIAGPIAENFAKDNESGAPRGSATRYAKRSSRRSGLKPVGGYGFSDAPCCRTTSRMCALGLARKSRLRRVDHQQCRASALLMQHCRKPKRSFMFRARAYINGTRTIRTIPTRRRIRSASCQLRGGVSGHQDYVRGSCPRGRADARAAHHHRPDERWLQLDRPRRITRHAVQHVQGRQTVACPIGYSNMVTDRGEDIGRQAHLLLEVASVRRQS